MENIQKIKLGDAATFINGYAFKPSDWSKEGLPIIRIQNLTERGKEINYYQGEYNKKYEINYGDILISWSASLGVYIWKGEKAILNQHIFKVVFDKYPFVPRYFMYLIESKIEEMKQKVHGATMQHITKSNFNNIVIDYISMDKQEEIAGIFDWANELLALKREQINKLDLLVKSRFVEMFGDPVTNSMGWEEKKLSECLTNIENGKSFVCDNRSRKENQPALLKLSAVTYGEYRYEENKAIMDETMFVKKAEVKAGNLLFTRKNTPELVGMSAFVYSTPPNLMMPDLIFRLNTNNSCNKVYLWKLINLKQFRCKVTDLASGSAKSMSNISKERLLKLVIPVPPIDIQNQFAAFVHQVDKLKFETQKSIDETQMLLNALMQKYFD